MSVARFIADQRNNYRVPHTITCLLLGVSLAWFYKWRDRPPTKAFVSRRHILSEFRSSSEMEGKGDICHVPEAQRDTLGTPLLPNNHVQTACVNPCLSRSFLRRVPSLRRLLFLV